MTDIDTQDLPSQPQERRFDELTLAEMLRELFRAPAATVGALRVILNAPRRQSSPMVKMRAAYASVQTAVSDETGEWEPVSSTTELWAWVRLGLWFMAVIAGVTGCLAVYQVLFNGERIAGLNFTDVKFGFWWWIAAMILGVAAETIGWYGGLTTPRPERVEPSVSIPFRWFAFAAAFPLGALAYLGQGFNEFTVGGVLGWVLCVMMLCIAFWPRGVNLQTAGERVITGIIAAPRKKPWVMLGLLAVMLVAGYMRFARFDTIPLEMTSDHIEKLLDSQRVADGARDIFFASNGGREPFQMYFVAFLGSFTGGLNFNTLKLAAAIESLAGVLVFYFLGRAIVGEDSRFADGFGLLFALMGAVGYWHLVVTRVSLRIMLTPLITSLTLWALVRLVRWNRRGDAIWAGLLLGAGVYGYQALRLLPVLGALAVVIGVVLVAKTWRQRGAYLVNLLVMAALSFAVFLPLLRYANDYPDDFWRRASGRLLGEDSICDYDANNGCIPRSPTLGERIEAFSKNIPALGENFVRALGMFTYRGDVAWLHNAPNYPVFEPLMGGFLMVGIGASVVWGIRRRDVVPLFLILSLLVMLVPSASAIANVIENPSNTRASGAMPSAYFLAAFGLAGVIAAVAALMPVNWRTPVAVIMATGVAFLSGSQAQNILFGPYDDFYQTSWSPEREAGEFVRGFVDSGGTWGNVYLLSYAHFFDYRGVAIQAGLKPGVFPNGDIAPESLPRFIGHNLGRRWDDPWVLDPTRDLLILYSSNDETTGDLLKKWFPTGYALYYETRKDTPWLRSEPFWAYRVPAPGREALEALITATQ